MGSTCRLSRYSLEAVEVLKDPEVKVSIFCWTDDMYRLLHISLLRLFILNECH